MKERVDILVPVYREEAETVSLTVQNLLALETDRPIGIIVIDDGNTPALSLEALPEDPRVHLVVHPQNRGYGAALKSGIRASSADVFAIIDADGTYPVEQLPILLAAIDDVDMVVGIRAGRTNETPLLRRFPKRVLNAFASYLANSRIVDLNSGMRVFRRGLAMYLWDLFPQRFSFTSTLTMGAILGGYRMEEKAIDYFKRSGKSSIHPIHDTIRFFRLAFRLGVLFAPMRIFFPLALVLFGVGFGKGVLVDYMNLGAVGNFSVAFMISGVQILMMGVLADLIVMGRKLRARPVKPERTD